MADASQSIEELRDDLRRLHAFMDNSPTAAFMKDAAGRYVYFNKRMENMFYAPLTDLEGKTDFDWLPEYLAAQIWSTDQTCLATNETVEVMQAVPHPDGSESHWLVFRFPFTNAAGEQFVGGVAADVTEMKEMQERLDSLTLTDELTQLNNRRGFLRLADARLKLARRTREQLHVLFADLDGLKKINDTYGHAAGSEAIVAAAAVLKESFRQTDVAARWGGDEFVVLLGSTDEDTQEILLGRVQQKIDNYNTRSGMSWQLSMSMGIVPIDLDSGLTLDEIVTHADAKMYEAKRIKKQERED